MDNGTLALLIPIGICIIMPIMIVWIISRGKNHEIDKKTDIILKAIENGQEIDPELFSGPKTQKNASTKKMLLDRLQNGVMITIIGVILLLSSLWGCSLMATEIQLLGAGVFLAIGISFLVAYFVGKKMLAKEMKAEEELCSQKSHD